MTTPGTTPPAANPESVFVEMLPGAKPAMPRERPILFSGPMIRAILDGRKTQTRRLVKPQPEPTIDGFFRWPLPSQGVAAFYSWSGRSPRFSPEWCPYGLPGDVLWVRETFVVETNQGFDSESVYRPPFKDGRPIRRCGNEDYGTWWEQCHYRATDPEPELTYEDEDGPAAHWKSSIHMPRWAARIFLRIKSVRVERVQDISEADARAEGVTPNWCGDLTGWHPDKHGFLLPGDENATDDTDEDAYFYTGRDAFEALWDSINGDRDGCSWSANPWCWCIEFERCDDPRKEAPNGLR